MEGYHSHLALLDTELFEFIFCLGVLVNIAACKTPPRPAPEVADAPNWLHTHRISQMQRAKIAFR